MDGTASPMDLRSRLIAAIDDGVSCRAAAARFGVAPSTAIRWHSQRREDAHVKPKAQGGDMRSHRVEKRASDILALCEANRDITLEELRTELSKAGFGISIAGLNRFFKRHGMTQKKDRPRPRAGSPGRPEATPPLVRRSTGPRSGGARLHR